AATLTYDITFINLLGGTPLQPIKVDGGNTTTGGLTGATGTTAIITPGVGNEVQDIALPTAADASTGGTFAMVYLSDAVSSQTIDVPFSADADTMVSNIQAGLNSLFGGTSALPNVKAYLLERNPDLTAKTIEISATNVAAVGGGG